MNIIRYFLVWLLSFAFTSLIDAIWHLGIFKKAYSEGIRPLARITVYGLTNYALFKDWSLKLTVLEVIWGPMLGSSSGVFVIWIKSILVI